MQVHTQHQGGLAGVALRRGRVLPFVEIEIADAHFFFRLERIERVLFRLFRLVFFGWRGGGVLWRAERQSILTLYRQLLATRRAHPALSIGAFALIAAEGDVLAYERRIGTERLIVALNLGGRPLRMALPDWASQCRPLLSTVDDAVITADGALLLRADEGVILKVG